MLQHKILKEVKVEKMRRVGKKTDLNSRRYFFYEATSVIDEDIMNVVDWNSIWDKNTNGVIWYSVRWSVCKYNKTEQKSVLCKETWYLGYRGGTEHG